MNMGKINSLLGNPAFSLVDLIQLVIVLIVSFIGMYVSHDLGPWIFFAVMLGTVGTVIGNHLSNYNSNLQNRREADASIDRELHDPIAIDNSVNHTTGEKILANCTTKIFLASSNSNALEYKGLGVSKNEVKNITKNGNI